MSKIDFKFDTIDTMDDDDNLDKEIDMFLYKYHINKNGMVTKEPRSQYNTLLPKIRIIRFIQALLITIVCTWITTLFFSDYWIAGYIFCAGFIISIMIYNQKYTIIKQMNTNLIGEK